tara:strand:+ start:295 stop:582 length:288 start_codon:yes stop_codon:yes gene_type:complete
MIDTDKYEGHTPAPWGSTCKAPWTVMAIHEGSKNTHPDMKLIYDAPLLLEAYKRLRRVINDVVVDLTVTNIGGPDGQGVAVKAALNTLSEVIDVD